MQFQVWALLIFQGSWDPAWSISWGLWLWRSLSPWALLRPEQCLYHTGTFSPAIPHHMEQAQPCLSDPFWRLHSLWCKNLPSQCLPLIPHIFHRKKKNPPNIPEFLRKPVPLQEPGFHTQLQNGRSSSLVWGEHKSMGVAAATACAMANDTPASWSGWGRQQAFAGGHDGNRAGGKGPGRSSASILLLAPCAWLGAIGWESFSPAAFWLLQALSHVWLCWEKAGERWPSLPFIPSKVELVPSSQPPASLTKPGCCLQSAWARLACSHSSSPPGRVAEAAGRRRFVTVKTQGCVC